MANAWHIDALKAESARLGVDSQKLLAAYPTGKPDTYDPAILASLGAKPNGGTLKANGNGKPKANGNGVSGTPTLAEALARIAELEAQQSGKTATLTLKVSEGGKVYQDKKTGEITTTKGGTAVLYGVRRFPLSFYPDEWTRILDHSDAIRDFIKANHAKLTWKHGDPFAK